MMISLRFVVHLLGTLQEAFLEGKLVAGAPPTEFDTPALRYAALRGLQRFKVGLASKIRPDYSMKGNPPDTADFVLAAAIVEEQRLAEVEEAEKAEAQVLRETVGSLFQAARHTARYLREGDGPFTVPPEAATELVCLVDKLSGVKSAVVEPAGNKEKVPEGWKPVSLYDVEKAHILNMLTFTDWNKSTAAGALGIERSTLDRKLKEYGVTRPAR